MFPFCVCLGPYKSREVGPRVTTPRKVKRPEEKEDLRGRQMEQELDEEDEHIGGMNLGGHSQIGLPIGAYLGLVTPGSALCNANGFPERSWQSRGRKPKDARMESGGG